MKENVQPMRDDEAFKRLFIENRKKTEVFMKRLLSQTAKYEACELHSASATLTCSGTAGWLVSISSFW